MQKKHVYVDVHVDKATKNQTNQSQENMLLKLNAEKKPEASKLHCVSSCLQLSYDTYTNEVRI